MKTTTLLAKALVIAVSGTALAFGAYSYTHPSAPPLPRGAYVPAQSTPIAIAPMPPGRVIIETPAPVTPTPASSVCFQPYWADHVECWTTGSPTNPPWLGPTIPLPR